MFGSGGGDGVLLSRYGGDGDPPAPSSTVFPRTHRYGSRSSISLRDGRVVTYCPCFVQDAVVVHPIASATRRASPYVSRKRMGWSSTSQTWTSLSQGMDAYFFQIPKDRPVAVFSCTGYASKGCVSR